MKSLIYSYLGLFNACNPPVVDFTESLLAPTSCRPLSLLVMCWNFAQDLMTKRLVIESG